MSAQQPNPSSILSQTKNTSKLLQRTAFGVLFLFAIASTIAGWGGNRLGTVILIVFIVFGFMIALVGFDRLAKARHGYYAKLAAVLSTITLGAIVALFVTVACYIGFGHPIWLDRFFGYQISPAPTGEIGPGTITPASMTVSLRPYEDGDAIFSFTVYAGEDVAPIGPPIQKSGNTERLLLTGLKQATKYRVRVVAVHRYRESRPLDLYGVTAASNLLIRLPALPNISVSYSGHLDDNLLPNDEKGKVTFEISSEYWIFRGPVIHGNLSGVGTMSTETAGRNFNCGDNTLYAMRECSSFCSRTVFENGLLHEADCSVVLRNLSWREKDKEIEAEGGGAYIGQLAANADGPGILIGPFRMTYDGTGKLVGRKDKIEGVWADGALQGTGQMHLASGEVRSGEFERGVLKEGVVYSQPGILSEGAISYNVKQFAPNGAAVWLGTTGFGFGQAEKFDPIHSLASGFQGRSEGKNFRLDATDENGAVIQSYHPKLDRDSDDCMNGEYFGLPGTDNWWDIGWHLFDINHIPEVDNDKVQVDATLDLEAPDIHVRAFREPDEPADIRFWIGNNFDAKQQIKIDDKIINTNTIYDLPQAHAALTLANLCYAKTISNMTNGKSLNISGFCPVVAVLIARVYYCSAAPDSSKPSPWYQVDHFGNWQVTTSKKGTDPSALKIRTREADLKTNTANYDYHILIDCVDVKGIIVGLGLWGADLMQDAQNATRTFDFSATGKALSVSFQTPRGGVYHVDEQQRVQLLDFIRNYEKFTAKTTGSSGESVSFSFDGAGARDAINLALSSCQR